MNCRITSRAKKAKTGNGIYIRAHVSSQTIDYCVIKSPPTDASEKFPDADETLTTQMKSVSEAMAISRTFKEALAKRDSEAWKSNASDLVSMRTTNH